MRWGIFTSLAILSFTIQCASAEDISKEKEGIMQVVARMMKCNDLSVKSSLRPAEAEKAAQAMEKLGCATVSCDLMKIVDRYFPDAAETADTKAQMAALGVCN